MTTNRLITILAALTMCCAATAAPVTYFGEDLNTAGDMVRITPTNSMAAQSDFLAAVGGSGTEDFEMFPSMQFTPFTIMLGGVTTGEVSGMGLTFLLELPTNAGRFQTSGENYFESSPMSPYTITFAAPINAFGFFATDAGDEGGQLQLTLNGPGGMQQLLVPHMVSTGQVNSGSALFFGFRDTAAAYTSVQFAMTNQADVFGIDDLSVAPAAAGAIPEPSTWTLLAGGGLALAWIRRRRIVK